MIQINQKKKKKKKKNKRNLWVRFILLLFDEVEVGEILFEWPELWFEILESDVFTLLSASVLVFELSKGGKSSNCVVPLEEFEYDV